MNENTNNLDTIKDIYISLTAQEQLEFAIWAAQTGYAQPKAPDVIDCAVSMALPGVKVVVA